MEEEIKRTNDGNEGNKAFVYIGVIIIIGVGIIVLVFYLSPSELGLSDSINLNDAIQRMYEGIRNLVSSQELDQNIEQVYEVYENSDTIPDCIDMGIDIDMRIVVEGVVRDKNNAPDITYEIVEAPENGSKFELIGVGYIPYDSAFQPSYRNFEAPIKDLNIHDLVNINWDVWNTNFFPPSIHYLTYAPYPNSSICHGDYAFKLPGEENLS